MASTEMDFDTFWVWFWVFMHVFVIFDKLNIVGILR